MKQLRYFILLLILIIQPSTVASAQVETSVQVRAVLFYSPTCPHCATVINEDLPPIMETYGDRLHIIGINTLHPDGRRLFLAAVETFTLPREKQVVPMLIVGEVILIGGREIPDQFPTLIEQGLDQGGIDWPDIPGLQEVLDSQQANDQSPTPDVESTVTRMPTLTQQPTQIIDQTNTRIIATPIAQNPGSGDSSEPMTIIGQSEIREMVTEDPPPDPIGFALAGIVFLGMLGGLGVVGWKVPKLSLRSPAFDHNKHSDAPRSFTQIIPILCFLGLVISGYLAYVELTQAQAVCGPVGECNIVQSSQYAQIFGIPIALLGLIFYVAVIFLWMLAGIPKGRWIYQAWIAMLGLSILGTVFSMYLTTLEIFIIKAVCAWCLSSALVTTLLMVVILNNATQHFSPGQHNELKI